MVSWLSVCPVFAIFPKKHENQGGLRHVRTPHFIGLFLPIQKKGGAKSQISLDFSPSLWYTIFQWSLSSSIMTTILEIV